MTAVLFRLSVVTLWLIGSGCASAPPVVPPELDRHIDRSIAFPDVLSATDRYQGRTVLLGGEIVAVSRLAEGLQLEILQLPLSHDDVPADNRALSQGRVIALARDGGDVASWPEGTLVTMVGEVTGVAVRVMDESEYRYPLVDVIHLHVWEPSDYERRRSSRLANFFSGLGLGLSSGAMTPRQPDASRRFGGVGLGTY